MMNGEADLYWLAGLLEGEGSFVKGPPSKPSNVAVQLAMTDHDVVERVSRLFDRTFSRSDRGVELGLKPVFITAIKGAGAARLMRALHPVMGKRRRTQIERALSVPHRTEIRWKSPRLECAVSACPDPGKVRGICRRHYRSWWKATRAGRQSPYAPQEAPPPAGIAELPGALKVPSPDEPAACHWLAGLLEGEGTFSNQSGYPRISVQMTDRDVVERAAAILGIQKVHIHIEKRDPDWLPTHVAALTGSRAAPWMRALRPLMGERRSGEIDRALGAYHPIRLVEAPDTCVVTGCAGEHRGRGLCHNHYMSWSRDVRRGRTPRITPLR